MERKKNIRHHLYGVVSASAAKSAQLRSRDGITWGSTTENEAPFTRIDAFNGNDKKDVYISKMPKQYRKPKQKPIRKRYRRRFRTKIPISVTPSSIIRRLPTAFYNEINPGAGTLGIFQLYANSALDPLAGVSPSVQPMGMDQYELLYDRYCVVGYKLHIQAVTSDNTNPMVIGVTPMTTPTAKTSYLHYMELPGTVSRVVTPDIDRVIFTCKGSVRKWLLPKGGKLLTDDTCQAIVSADPARLLYLHVWAQAQDSTADPSAIKMTIRMEQIVVFFGRKATARSTQ